MGILDGLLGEVIDNLSGHMPGIGAPGSAPATPANAPAGNPLVALALELLQQNGGIGGLLSRMQQAGYGAQAQSWIGTGRNQPISPDALAQVFGGQLGPIAQRLGIPPDEMAGHLAQALPEVVDRMTPQGQIPAGDSDFVANVLAALRKNA